MIEAIGPVHVLLLSALLMIGGVAKLTTRGAGRVGGPAALLPSGAAGPATVILALAEIALGIGLLVSAHPAVRAMTVIAFACATWVIKELRSRRPGAGCGCFGTLSGSPVDARTLLRAGLLTAAAASTLGVSAGGIDVLADLTAFHLAVLALELALLTALSPEVGAMLGRLRRRVPCELRTRPVEETRERLRASAAWRRLERVLTAGEPADVWRELCWRYFAYPGRVNGERVDVVFAVYLDGRRPPVRAAIVRDGDGVGVTGAVVTPSLLRNV